VEKQNCLVDFFCCIAYTIHVIGGILMNEFEKSVQSKRNDAVDSGVGFVVSFGFFATIFVMATLIHYLGS
jgi:short subunit fatty acids transporter